VLTQSQSREELSGIVHALRARLAEADSIFQDHYLAEVESAYFGSAKNGTRAGPQIGAGFQHLFGGRNIGAAILEAGHVILQANCRLAEILGLPPQEIPGLALSDWIVPEDREEFIFSFLEACFGYPSQTIVRLRGNGGSPVPVLLSLSPLRDRVTLKVCMVVMVLSNSEIMRMGLRKSGESNPLRMEEGADSHRISNSPSLFHAAQQPNFFKIRGLEECEEDFTGPKSRSSSRKILKGSGRIRRWEVESGIGEGRFAQPAV
jgi:PAS domain S-box-containing protein